MNEDTLTALALRLLHGPGSNARTILGLAGPPGAGKSTLARHLVAEVERHEGPGSAAYLPLDGFHLSAAQLDRLGLSHRKGAPATFDAHGYIALLRRVAADRFQHIYVPDFDRDLDEPVAARHVVAPHARLVITEGNYLAAAEHPWPEAAGCCASSGGWRPTTRSARSACSDAIVTAAATRPRPGTGSAPTTSPTVST
ncbi:hypothetical protein ACFQ0M_18870 [Kitasatospora aburaviensis]